MFRQLFTSEPPHYYLPSERYGIPTGIGLGSLYNPYLVTPPRIYAEALYPGGFLIGAFVKKERTPYSDFTIHLMSAVDIIYWPSYDFRHWWFDGITGAYLGTDDFVSNALFGHQLYQMRDGSVWAQFDGGGWGEYFYEVEQLTFTEIAGTRQEPSKFGATTCHYPIVDRAADLVIMKSSNEGLFEIGVYNLTSGALVRRISLPGMPVHLFAEDATRCYAVTTRDGFMTSASALLSLVDYATGRVITTLRAPGREAGALDYFYAWDRFLRRVLVFTQRADDTDGACLSTFAGYYPVPLSVGMTAPIPLKAPRANRRTPFLCKVYGDAGEAITGVKITPVAGTSTIVGAPPFTDSDGEAIITLIPDAAGTDTLVVTSDVDA